MPFQAGYLISVVLGDPIEKWESICATYIVTSVLTSRHYRDNCKAVRLTDNYEDYYLYVDRRPYSSVVILSYCVVQLVVVPVGPHRTGLYYSALLCTTLHYTARHHFAC